MSSKSIWISKDKYGMNEGSCVNKSHWYNLADISTVLEKLTDVVKYNRGIKYKIHRTLK